MKFRNSLVFLALFCAVPASTFVAGCGGGSSGPSLPAGVVAGSYSGSYFTTLGTDFGQTGAISLTIDSGGNITGTGIGNGTVSFLSGTADLSSGSFSIFGLFGGLSVGDSATGVIESNNGTVTGSGTFTRSNGDTGTITLAKD